MSLNYTFDGSDGGPYVREQAARENRLNEARERCNDKFRDLARLGLDREVAGKLVHTMVTLYDNRELDALNGLYAVLVGLARGMSEGEAMCDDSAEDAAMYNELRNGG